MLQFYGLLQLDCLAQLVQKFVVLPGRRGVDGEGEVAVVFPFNRYKEIDLSPGDLLPDNLFDFILTQGKGAG
jgi:hypothetical protein